RSGSGSTSPGISTSGWGRCSSDSACCVTARSGGSASRARGRRAAARAQCRDLPHAAGRGRPRRRGPLRRPVVPRRLGPRGMGRQGSGVITLSALLGQPRAQAFLKGVLARRRFVNAYLFVGPWGVGKCSAALAFAAGVNCEREGDDACGECASCRKAAKLQHPDIHFLFPVSGEEKDLEENVAATLAAMLDDPVYVHPNEKAASIRLSLTRALLREMAYQPFESGHRIVVVRDADRMREDHYSAMLKSLEEPSSRSMWVLTSSRPHRLP